MCIRIQNCYTDSSVLLSRFLYFTAKSLSIIINQSYICTYSSYFFYPYPYPYPYYLSLSIITSFVPITHNHINIHLLGLQGMDSTHYETRNLLRVLTQKLLESDVAFTGQGRSSEIFCLSSQSLLDIIKFEGLKCCHLCTESFLFKRGKSHHPILKKHHVNISICITDYSNALLFL